MHLLYHSAHITILSGVRQGETVVQRGTVHAWHNRTQQMTRMLFVLSPSETVKIDGEELGGGLIPKIRKRFFRRLGERMTTL